MRIAIYIFVPLILIGCTRPDEAAPAKTAPDPTDVEHIAKTYRNLQSMTKQPVVVDSRFAMLCRDASFAFSDDAARKAFGPHAHTAVIYMNDLAAAGFKTRDGVYPAGSIIVKEKKALPHS